jgi:hypothetical protein
MITTTMAPHFLVMLPSFNNELKIVYSASEKICVYDYSTPNKYTEYKYKMYIVSHIIVLQH